MAPARLMTIKRILCPTALTAGSDGALRFALALARAYDAKLIAFHCKPASGNGVLAQSEVKVSLEESGLQASIKRIEANMALNPHASCTDPLSAPVVNLEKHQTLDNTQAFPYYGEVLVEVH